MAFRMAAGTGSGQSQLFKQAIGQCGSGLSATVPTGLTAAGVTAAGPEWDMTLPGAAQPTVTAPITGTMDSQMIQPRVSGGHSAVLRSFAMTTSCQGPRGWENSFHLPSESSLLLQVDVPDISTLSVMDFFNQQQPQPITKTSSETMAGLSEILMGSGKRHPHWTSPNVREPVAAALPPKKLKTLLSAGVRLKGDDLHE